MQNAFINRYHIQAQLQGAITQNDKTTQAYIYKRIFQQKTEKT